jgi:hypothetical protein
VSGRAGDGGTVRYDSAVGEPHSRGHVDRVTYAGAGANLHARSQRSTITNGRAFIHNCAITDRHAVTNRDFGSETHVVPQRGTISDSYSISQAGAITDGDSIA